jgi:23S rRNA (uracil1939-C5)-methyltransferase
LQHLEPGAQLRYKEKILLDNLVRIGHVEPETVMPAITAECWHYRRKARLGVKLVPKKGGILVGFRERQSSFITSLQHCDTLDQRISDLLPGLHQLVEMLGNNNRIPQIEVAAGDENVALIFRHLEPLSDQDRHKLRDYAGHNEVFVYTQSAGPDSVTALWPENPPALSYRHDAFDIELQFSPTDFIQVNASVNQAMVRQACEHLQAGPGDRVLDLFCGLGNFTLAMARSGASVTGVEGDDYLVRQGAHNADFNEMENANFQKFDLHRDDTSALAGAGFNRMLIDPPRSGAFEVVSQLVPMLRPERLIYISCNPATLARDADVLVNSNGYRLSAAGAIDMFPHTAHVESMAVFELPG